MAACPKCRTSIHLILSDQATCSSCKRRLKAALSPGAKPALVTLLVFVILMAILISAAAGSIDYPFAAKWALSGVILPGLIILSIVLLLFVMQRFVELRLTG